MTTLGIFIEECRQLTPPLAALASAPPPNHLLPEDPRSIFTELLAAISQVLVELVKRDEGTIKGSVGVLYKSIYSYQFALRNMHERKSLLTFAKAVAVFVERHFTRPFTVAHQTAPQNPRKRAAIDPVQQDDVDEMVRSIMEDNEAFRRQRSGGEAPRTVIPRELPPLLPTTSSRFTMPRRAKPQETAEDEEKTEKRILEILAKTSKSTSGSTGTAVVKKEEPVFLPQPSTSNGVVKEEVIEEDDVLFHNHVVNDALVVDEKPDKEELYSTTRTESEERSPSPVESLSPASEPPHGISEEDDLHVQFCLWDGCKRDFESKVALRDHLIIEHMPSGAYMTLCGWEGCKEIQVHKYNFRRHICSHIGLKEHVCPEKWCGKSFARAHALVAHKVVHTNSRPFVCDWPKCGKTFAYAHNKRMHYRTHEKENPFRCHVCDRSFVRIRDISTHIRRRHGEDALSEYERLRREADEERKAAVVEDETRIAAMMQKRMPRVMY